MKIQIYHFIFFVFLGPTLLFSEAQASRSPKELSRVVTIPYNFKLESRQCAAFSRLAVPYAFVEVPLALGPDRRILPADAMKLVELVDEPPVFPEVSSNGVAISVVFYKNQRKLGIQAYATNDFKGPVGPRLDVIPMREAVSACEEYVTKEGREFQVQYRVPVY